MAADAHRPVFDFVQEDVNLASFQIGRMAQGLRGSDLAGHDVPPVFAFVAEIGVLHRVLNPPGLAKVLLRAIRY